MTELRAIRGMNDIVPPEGERWRAFETRVIDVIRRYGYREIRLPLVEFTQVFGRSIGDTTDIVQKEMYTFTDRSGDSLTLRPEGTAGCVRAALENNLLNTGGAQRLFYLGPMFRHERPQKGRYRQFHQIGVETFGMAGPDIDAELIMMTARLWRTLGLQNLRLEINTLGTPLEREHYRTHLVEYFTAFEAQLDDESRVRLARNPMRILDSKNPALKEINANAPRLMDFLQEESRAHFAAVCDVLSRANIAFNVNTQLVRGLDYYSKTVFEWVTDALGAQGTVCAGGRYDGLVEQMGGKPTPAIGFALGIERLLELCGVESDAADADVYVIGAGADARLAALLLADAVRDTHPTYRVLSHCGGESIKSQMKRADRSGARIALILGADELANDTVTLKPLRGQGDQQTLARRDLVRALAAYFA